MADSCQSISSFILLPEIGEPHDCRTPGPLGFNDHGDPNACCRMGDTPGPLGINDHAEPKNDSVVSYTEEEILLAATAYGEASLENVYEEMAGIASVIVRQSTARSVSIKTLLGPANTYAFAASNGGNDRFKALKNADAAKRQSDAGMRDALKAARNALNGGYDYSNGGYFWDGVDLKTNYAKHPKVTRGIRFADPKHNIFGVKEKEIPEVVVHWQHRDKHNNLVNGKERGRYAHTFVSTAAHGKTVFWRYNDDFLQATGNKAYH